jgi:hypothetical protein
MIVVSRSRSAIRRRRAREAENVNAKLLNLDGE